MCLWHPLPYSFGSSHSQVIVWTVVVKPTHKNSAPAPGCEWSHLLVESILQLVNHFGMSRGTVDYVELPDNLYHFLPLPNRVPSLQQKKAHFDQALAGSNSLCYLYSVSSPKPVDLAKTLEDSATGYEKGNFG